MTCPVHALHASAVTYDAACQEGTSAQWARGWALATLLAISTVLPLLQLERSAELSLPQSGMAAAPGSAQRGQRADVCRHQPPARLHLPGSVHQGGQLSQVMGYHQHGALLLQGGQQGY